MKIDLHAHWRPPALIDAMRARSATPRILRNDAGVEIIKTRNTEEPVADAFDDVPTRLAEMDRHGITTAVLSLLGAFSSSVPQTDIAAAAAEFDRAMNLPGDR